MKLVDHFNTFLDEEVNLNKTRVDPPFKEHSPMVSPWCVSRDSALRRSA